MTSLRALAVAALAVAAAAGVAGPVVAAPSDYPPSGAVVVIAGDLVPGGAVEVAVHNCSVGEAVRTSLDSMGDRMSMCETGLAGLVEARDAPTRRPGVSVVDLRLPSRSGNVTGHVELLGSGEVLDFFIDLAAPAADPELPPPPVPSATSGPVPGWPFLLLAALIIVGVLLLALRDRRRLSETP